MNRFEIPRRFEAAYRRAIILLLAREISLNFNSVDEWLTQMTSLSGDSEFVTESRRIAVAMVRDIGIYNSTNWKSLAREVSGGSRFIPQLHILNENTQKVMESEIDRITLTISTIPQRLSKRLTDIVANARSLGNSEQEIFFSIRNKYAPLLIQRVGLLTQTDPHKINSKITESRSKDFDLPCFIWSTSKDEVVRTPHQKMDGVLVFWNHLPIPEHIVGAFAYFGRYAPGGCPNCRCSAIPVTSIDELFTSIRSRVKVYWYDSIRSVTKLQFMRLIAQEAYATVN